MKPHQDHQYIVAFRDGNFRLIEELYKEYSSNVKRWITDNSGTTEDAKDIFQEAIISIMNKAYDPKFVLTYPIGGLIFQIAKNKWTDELRKKNSQKKVRFYDNFRLIKREEDFTVIVEQLEEEEERQKKLDTTFQQLSDRCKKLLKLFSQGVKPKEIVNSLLMNNVNTVYRRKNACLQRWKELFYS